MRNYPYLALLLAGMVFMGTPPAQADGSAIGPKHKIDRSGKKQHGVAKVEVKPVAIPPPSADPKEEVLKQEKTVDPPK